MRIVVTGGAGFVGSHLAEALVEREHEVIILDDLSNGTKAHLEAVVQPDRLHFIEGSVLDRQLVKDVLKDCDAVYHLSAVLGVKNTVEHPLKVIYGNIDGTRIILETAFLYGTKVIFTSTSEIYGKNSRLPFTEQSDRVLGPPQIHRWCYATAKALDEHLIFAYAEHGLPATVARLFNAYGPRQTSSQYGGVIPKFIVAALRNEDITVYGSGEQSRCFTYVGDTVNGLLQCMERTADHHAFNIGSTFRLTINELAGTIRQLAGSSSRIVHVPYETAYGPGYEDMKDRVPDIGKAADMLGYKPEVSITQGLLQTIAWYRRTMQKG